MGRLAGGRVLAVFGVLALASASVRVVEAGGCEALPPVSRTAPNGQVFCWTPGFG